MPETNDKVEPINVAEEMSRSFLDYSMSVIVSRALPDARDGLKPSQRRILYAMHDLSLFPGRQHRKCAKIAGDTSGDYHPHGEAVIYPTLVHMAQPWAMRERLVDGRPIPFSMTEVILNVCAIVQPIGEEKNLPLNVTYPQVLEKQLRVMDLTAITLCMERKIPLVVFNLKRQGNIARVVRGEDVGTKIVP